MAPRYEQISLPPQTMTPEPDLDVVLLAWHEATVRLEQSHQALHDEVRRLSAELEIRDRELITQRHLANQGRLAAHMAHEVHNNLVPVSLYLGVLRRRVADDAGTLEVLDKVESSITQLDATVNDLLDFADGRELCPTRFSLLALVTEVQSLLAPQLAMQLIGITNQIPAGLEVVADRELLRRALLNLSLNALEAMPHAGQMVVSSYLDAGSVEIEVGDSGQGLSAEVQRRAFEPFFTTKPGNTGLGLAVVQRVAEAHGGSVTAMNGPEGGAAFTIRIPQRFTESTHPTAT